jgi:hypothetical protein
MPYLSKCYHDKVKLTIDLRRIGNELVRITENKIFSSYDNSVKSMR